MCTEVELSKLLLFQVDRLESYTAEEINNACTQVTLLKEEHLDRLLRDDCLYSVFHLAIKLLQKKMDEVSEYEDVLQDYADDYAGRLVKLEDRVKILTDENRTLRARSASQAGIDTNELLEDKEINEIRQKCDILQMANDDLAREKMELNSIIENLRKDLEKTKKEIQTCNARYEQLQSACKAQQSLEANQREKLRKQIHKVTDLTDENVQYASEISCLQSKIELLENAVNESTLEVEKSAADLQEMLVKLETEKAKSAELENKLNELTANRADNMEPGKFENRVMTAVCAKLQKWKAILDEKNSEISALKSEAAALQKQLDLAGLSHNGVLAVKNKEIIEREKRIMFLEAKLNESTREISRTTETINMLRHEIAAKNSRTMDGSCRDSTKLEYYEDEMKEKDAKLLRTIKKITDYEMGDHHLQKAVAEARSLKNQLEIRDKEISELIEEINGLYMNFEDITIENNELRSKLGLSGKKQTFFHDARTRNDKMSAQIKATIPVLLQEIETLEEERLNLKQYIRYLAKKLGSKSESEGLDPGLMVLYNEDEVKSSRAEMKAVEHLKSIISAYKKRMKVAEERNLSTQLENERLTAENQCLINDLLGISASLSSFRNYFDPQATGTTIPGDDEMILKDVAKRRNLAAEIQKSIRELISSLPNSADWPVHHVQIPNSQPYLNHILSNDSSDVSQNVAISVLSAELAPILAEFNNLQNVNASLESSVVRYKTKFDFLKHQFALLYEEHFKHRTDWQNEKERLEQEINEIKYNRDSAAIELEEYKRLLEDLKSDNEAVIKRSLCESSRNVAVLKCNERRLLLKIENYKLLEENLRKELENTRKDEALIEETIRKKVGFLERSKSWLEAKLKCSQQAAMKSQSNFNDFLDAWQRTIEKFHLLSNVFDENLSQSIEQVRRCHGKDLAVPVVSATGYRIDDSNQALDGQPLIRHRGHDTYFKLYESAKETEKIILDNLKRTEEELKNLKEENLKLKLNESKLLLQSAESIDKVSFELCREKVNELELLNTKLQMELSTAKETADIALLQLESSKFLQDNSQSELLFFKQQLIDLRSKSQEYFETGFLHQKIYSLSLSEACLSKKLEKSKNDIKALESSLLQMKIKLEAEKQSRFKTEKKYTESVNRMRLILYELYVKSSGLITVQHLQRTLAYLADVKKLSNEMFQKLTSAEGRYLEMKSLYEESQKTDVKLTNGHHSSLNEISNDHIVLKRENIQLSEEVKYIKELLQSTQNFADDLEVDYLKLHKSYDDAVYNYETKISELQARLDQHCHTDEGFDEFAGTHDLHTSRSELELDVDENAVLISTENKRKEKVLQKKISEQCSLINNLEKQLLSRDKLIEDLRSQIPFQINALLSTNTHEKSGLDVVTYEKTMCYTHSVIQNLQARLSMKENQLDALRQQITTLQLQNNMLKRRGETLSVQKNQPLDFNTRLKDQKTFPDERRYPSSEIIELKEYNRILELSCNELKEKLKIVECQENVYKEKFSEMQKRFHAKKMRETWNNDCACEELQNEVQYLRNKCQDLECSVKKTKSAESIRCELSNQRLKLQLKQKDDQLKTLKASLQDISDEFNSLTSELQRNKKISKDYNLNTLKK